MLAGTPDGPSLPGPCAPHHDRAITATPRRHNPPVSKRKRDRPASAPMTNDHRTVPVAGSQPRANRLFELGSQLGELGSPHKPPRLGDPPRRCVASRPKRSTIRLRVPPPPTDHDPDPQQHQAEHPHPSASKHPEQQQPREAVVRRIAEYTDNAADPARCHPAAETAQPPTGRRRPRRVRPNLNLPALDSHARASIPLRQRSGSPSLGADRTLSDLPGPVHRST
jgi:hypothetical protein